MGRVACDVWAVISPRPHDVFARVVRLGRNLLGGCSDLRGAPQGVGRGSRHVVLITVYAKDGRALGVKWKVWFC